MSSSYHILVKSGPRTFGMNDTRYCVGAELTNSRFHREQVCTYLRGEDDSHLVDSLHTRFSSSNFELGDTCVRTEHCGIPQS